MPPTLPTASNFPPTAVLSIIPPPPPRQPPPPPSTPLQVHANTKAQPQPQRPPTNVLILLHGLGDSRAAFAQLGAQLSLPDTVCLAVQAPAPLPFELGGFHWGDDIVFDQANGGIDPDGGGFTRACRLVYDDIIVAGLIEQCGYQARNILFYGFGQGGMVALQVAANTELEFGGVISVGGPLPAAAVAAAAVGTTNSRPSSKRATPVLVLGGSSKSLITTSAVRQIKDSFGFVQVHQFDRPGDSMPASRAEMLPVMQFLARRLQSQAGVPAGSIPLS